MKLRSYLCAMALAVTASSAMAEPQVILNGSKFKTVTGDDVRANGAGIIKVGAYYYMIGENRKDTGGFNAISMYRSVDLKNWEFRRDVLTYRSAPLLEMSNIERPKIIYNAATRKYVIWGHYENGINYSEARVIVATSSTIDGNYAFKGSFRPLDFSSRDMTLYQDDDGKAYLISATNNNYDLNVYRLNASFTGIDSLVYTFKGYHKEAPAVFKRGSTYFMVGSGATGWTPNQGVYFTAPSITGPWSGPVNFSNGTTYSSQSTFVLPIKGTQITSYMYMGDRWGPAQGQRINESQYVWLPLRFPTSTTLAMDGRSQITVDTVTGSVTLGGDTPLQRIRSARTGRCANVSGNQLLYGRSVIHYPCSGASNEMVEERPSGKDVQFVFQQSGLCLAQNDEVATGGPVVQHGCTQARAQWYRVGRTIVNRRTGACLEVSAATSDTTLRTGRCDASDRQQWTVTA
jgi:hypothetical protein